MPFSHQVRWCVKIANAYNWKWASRNDALLLCGRSPGGAHSCWRQSLDGHIDSRCAHASAQQGPGHLVLSALCQTTISLLLSCVYENADTVHHCAGQLFTWGRGSEGQLGHGHAAVPVNRHEHVPRLVRSLAGKAICSASAGHAHSGGSSRGPARHLHH